jgi:UDP-N-acetylmuramoyl-tripeptide--D-alanyl-D-alanine ligase
MKSLIQNIIGQLTKKILSRYQPRIIAITGSVGKTSTKNAVAAVLGERYQVRVTEGNYNTEFGVPLSIIEARSPCRSVVGWLVVLAKAWRLAYGKRVQFPEVLILEYGAEKPGDIEYLCQIAAPDIGVITRVSPVHAANFDSVEKLAEEKGKLAECTKAEGTVVLNIDDEKVAMMEGRAHGKVLTYGFYNAAYVKADNFSFSTKADLNFEPGEVIARTMFTAEVNQAKHEIVLNNLIGLPAVFASLAAISVGLEMGLEMGEIVNGLSGFKPMAGRLQILPGIKGSILIDDSYNAAPAAVIAALDIVREFPLLNDSKRIAVLGEMLELGQYSEAEHRRVGKHVADQGYDVLVAVGERARDYTRGALEAGLRSDNIHTFKNSEEAGRFMDGFVHSGDVVLIKGSQGSRMEKVTKDIMAEPARAKELLVRQYSPWIDE